MTMSIPSAETITRTELPNGIVVLARENQASPSVVLSGYLWAGSLSEPASQAGLANFSGGMLMRGTETRAFGEINDMLESAGAQLGLSAGIHTTGFGGKALAEDLGLLLDVLDDCLEHPAFPLIEVEKLRGQILTSLQRRAFDTQRMAALTFDALLWPDHPYGRSVLGYEETILELTRDDLFAFYQQHYSPRGMVLAVVGAVPPEVMVEKVQTSLGGWLAHGVVPDRHIPSRVTLDERRLRTVPIPGKTQSDLTLGWPGVARTDADYLPAHLTNTVLGVFGTMGRLGSSIREEQGLAYYAYSELEAGWGQGSWSVVAGVDPANVERAVESVRLEVRRLRDEPVTDEELADSKSFLTGSMPLRLETNEGVARALLDMERYGLGLDYLQRFPILVGAVTVEDLREMACRYLDPDIYALAVAGPADAADGL
jgi:zinc protease